MNNNLQDLSGLSREDLLQLVAAQQNQLRSQHQQQEQQQRLALLGQAGPLFADRTPVAQPFGDFSALLGVQQTSNNSGGGLADLLLLHRALNGGGGLPPQETNAGITVADLLQAQVARLGSTQAQAQIQPQTQDPLRAIGQLISRREIVGNSAAAALPLLSDGLNSVFGNSNSEELRLRALFGASAQVQPSPQAQATLNNDCLRPGGNGSSQPSVAAAVAAKGPQTEPEQVKTKDEEKIAPAIKGAAGKKKTKRPLSAYNIFFKEEHAKIIAQSEQEKAERLARGEREPSDDEYSVDEGTGKKRKRSLSTNQPGKRGKRQVDFENLTKVIGKRWKDLPKERVEEYKRRAEGAMLAYRNHLFQKIRKSVKDDQNCQESDT